ncbi:MAG: hypothetical protein ABEH47_04380 [Haloferacaceae archaeon]
MVPLQYAIDLGWVAVLALLLGPGIVAAALCAPFLVAERVRALFRALPPRDGVAIPYVAATVGASFPYVGGTLWALSAGADAAGREGAAMADALLGVLLGLSATYVAAVPLLAGVALPRVGVDWDPAGYGAGTWALLVALGVWYAAVFAFPLFLFAVVLAFPA